MHAAAHILRIRRFLVEAWNVRIVRDLAMSRWVFRGEVKGHCVCCLLLST